MTVTYPAANHRSAIAYPDVHVGTDAIPRLIRFCREHALERLMVVADRNTEPVLGAAVTKALVAAGFDVRQVVLRAPEVVADSRHIQQVLIGLDGTPRTLISVGAGTLTDITRFVSHRMNCSFVALPTAPSVDGFASTGAPLIVDGTKITFPTQAPLAIYADLDTLMAAPRPMIAAGFGDMIGKYTSVADWRLGALLWDEPYDDGIARRTLEAVDVCVAQAADIGAASAEGIQSLMHALIDSGFCMLEFGDSRPASGAEHHISHFWEMKLLEADRPAVLHGAKVGVATLQIAAQYAALCEISCRTAADMALATRLTREQEARQIRYVYGTSAESVLTAQEPFLEWDEDAAARLAHRLETHWDEVQAIAHSVPAPAQIERLLRQVDAPTTPHELGFSGPDLEAAAANGHYLRNRFTISKLQHLLGQKPVSYW